MTLPWFIIVTDAGDAEVIDRQDFGTPVTFAGNASRVRVQSRPVALNLPAEERLVENHTVRLSFQLTPDQLAANRRRGRGAAALPSLQGLAARSRSRLIRPGAHRAGAGVTRPMLPGAAGSGACRRPALGMKHTDLSGRRTP